jgi:hypothetical protein
LGGGTSADTTSTQAKAGVAVERTEPLCPDLAA